MKSPDYLRIGFSVLFLSSGALACGPFFPDAFLPSRKAMLTAPIEGNFAFELGRYSQAVRSGKAEGYSHGTVFYEQIREKAETQGVTAEQYRTIQKIRKASDGDEAYKLGNGLPEAIRLYTAAAVDYQLAKKTSCADDKHRGACFQESCDGSGCYPTDIGSLPTNPPVLRALRRFEAVLALPKPDQALRATWAAYSIGEIYLNYKLNGRHEKALEHYALVQKLAKQGNPDPLNLAWASLGQQALIKLVSGDKEAAVKLYLEQGDTNSLRIVAETLVSQSEQKLRSDLKRRQLRRLVIAYVFSYGNPSPYSGKRPPWMISVIRYLMTLDIKEIEDADRLAAISYQTANYAHAAKLVEGSSTPLAHWVRSRLARRNGDMALASEHVILACEDDQAVLIRLPPKPTTGSMLSICADLGRPWLSTCLSETICRFRAPCRSSSASSLTRQRARLTLSAHDGVTGSSVRAYPVVTQAH